MKNIFKKWKEKRRKKREDFDKIINRINSPKFIKEGWKSGEHTKINTQNGLFEFIYLYSQYDSDYYMNLSNMTICSIESDKITFEESNERQTT